jgi:rubrerythrin
MTDIDAALAALEMAIQTEIDGHTFYQQFADRTRDPEAKAMFRRLAQDEVMHVELLSSTKAVLEENGAWSAYQGLTIQPVQGAPIFSRERVEQNIVAYSSDLSALRVAFLIEKDAVDFYTKAAEQTADSNGRRMYLDLVKMEQGHLELLEGEYRFLQGEFQTAMGFVPF